MRDTSNPGIGDTVIFHVLEEEHIGFVVQIGDGLVADFLRIRCGDEFYLRRKPNVCVVSPLELLAECVELATTDEI